MLDVILKRRSVRTYLDQNVKSEDLSKIKTIINTYDNAVGPLNHKIKLSIIDIKDKRSLGTYGIIKNPQMYIGGICVHVDEAMIDFGYVFEGLILDLTKEDLGTCWMAGTFKRHEFENQIEMDSTEIIPAVTPIGYFQKTRTFEQIMRKMIKADNRKPLKDIVFDTAMKPIDLKANHPYYRSIHAVQNAPSASNKQPWRLVIDEQNDIVHFYADISEKYNRTLGFPVQYIDMGIAMKHFELESKEKKTWCQIKHPDTEWEYMISYK